MGPGARGVLQEEVDDGVRVTGPLGRRHVAREDLSEVVGVRRCRGQILPEREGAQRVVFVGRIQFLVQEGVEEQRTGHEEHPLLRRHDVPRPRHVQEQGDKTRLADVAARHDAALGIREVVDAGVVRRQEEPSEGPRRDVSLDGHVERVRVEGPAAAARLEPDRIRPADESAEASRVQVLAGPLAVARADGDLVMHVSPGAVVVPELDRDHQIRVDVVRDVHREVVAPGDGRTEVPIGVRRVALNCRLDEGARHAVRVVGIGARDGRPSNDESREDVDEGIHVPPVRGAVTVRVVQGRVCVEAARVVDNCRAGPRPAVGLDPIRNPIAVRVRLPRVRDVSVRARIDFFRVVQAVAIGIRSIRQ